MSRLAFLMLTGTVLFLFGCTTSTTGPVVSCESNANAGPCTATFACGNSGTDCTAATQVCVSEDGSDMCIDVSGASETTCPSPIEAAALAGCTAAMCTGSPSAGITVVCSD